MVVVVPDIYVCEFIIQTAKYSILQIKKKLADNTMIQWTPYLKLVDWSFLIRYV